MLICLSSSPESSKYLRLNSSFPSEAFPSALNTSSSETGNTSMRKYASKVCRHQCNSRGLCVNDTNICVCGRANCNNVTSNNGVSHFAAGVKSDPTMRSKCPLEYRPVKSDPQHSSSTLALPSLESSRWFWCTLNAATCTSPGRSVITTSAPKRAQRMPTRPQPAPNSRIFDPERIHGSRASPAHSRKRHNFLAARHTRQPVLPTWLSEICKATAGAPSLV
mmetsp:Transcript_89100/g.285627  ORF Transcript_89100/g.285627 Transcript_89100/m.285627 type:complete len:221 (+) Transcript_89100:259-921(+)